MATQTHVFNQYYFDLLRKVKNIARDAKKVDDHDADARALLRAVKKTYATFDRTSDEYREWFAANTSSLDAFLIAEDSDLATWHTNSSILSECPYKEIDVALLSRLMKNQDALLYYFGLLCIFSQPLDAEGIPKIIQVLKGETVEGDLPERFTKLHAVLKKIETSPPKAATGPSDEMFKELEKTSLGKLAKEIMSEVNLDEISNTMGDGDIMKALTNPDGGLTKLLGTVSQKMISKMASGEIKQENLLADALKLATSIPGMMPGGGKGGKGGGLGDMSSMLSQVSKMAGMFGGDDGDIGSMLNSFMGGDKARKGGSRATVNTPAVNRAVMAKQMRRKLEKRRKEKENIEN